MDIRSEMTINELIQEFAKSGCFGAGRLATAVDIYQRMLDEKATIILGLAGAMVPAGFRKIIVTLIQKKLVDIIVSTGANMVHDALEAFGGAHYKGTWLIDDSSLHKCRVERIYDIFIPEDLFIKKFDNPILEVYREIASQFKGQVLSIKDFMWEVGKRIKDENSILHNAYKYRFPIFVPAIQDSCYGLQAWELKHRTQNTLVVDAFKDMDDFFALVRNSKKLGAILIGGGVPKNFIFQAAFKTKRAYNYAIQITMDRPEPGGLSGATLEEAVSWGKVHAEASRVTVYSDATICFPIMVAAVMERLKIT
jgi:deoxyhypusine synthase